MYSAYKLSVYRLKSDCTRVSLVSFILQLGHDVPSRLIESQAGRPIKSDVVQPRPIAAVNVQGQQRGDCLVSAVWTGLVAVSTLWCLGRGCSVYPRL